MIRAVTLNSGFDEFFEVLSPSKSAEPGKVVSHFTVAAGKGFNAARTARGLGGTVKAYGLVGSDDKDQFLRLLEKDNVESTLIAIAGSTRRNLTILGLQGHQPAIHYVADGFQLAEPEPFYDLMSRVCDDLQTGDIVSLHGSVPDGLSKDSWREFASTVSKRGGRIALDTYGDPLIKALHGPPILTATPNIEELSVLCADNAIDSRIATGLRRMLSGGVQIPIVTLGEKGAACLVKDNEFRVSLPAQNAKVHVGAGDAFMGGLLVGLQRRYETLDAVRFAIATANFHVSFPGKPISSPEIEKLVTKVAVRESFHE